MALATQCPHCHTTFRVAHDQLKLRAGLVRCGSCKEIFNGIEHLLPSETVAATRTPAPAVKTPAAPAPAPAPAAAPAPVEAAPAPKSAPVPASKMPSVSDQLDFAYPDMGEDERAAAPVVTAPDPIPDTIVEPRGSDPVEVEFVETPRKGPPPGPAVEPEPAHAAHHEAPPVPTPAPAPPPIPETNTAIDPLTRMTLVDADDLAAMPPPNPDEPDPLDKVMEDFERKPARGGKRKKPYPRGPLAGQREEMPREEPAMEAPAPEPAPAPKPAAASNTYSDAEEPDFVKRERKKRTRGRTVGIVMGIGSVLLFFLALGQGAYIFRDQLAARLPETRPALDSFCSLLDCKVGLPAQIEAITFDGEQFEMLTTRKDTGEFSITLRNTARVTQAWPQLELTLKDNGNVPLARRVFAPQDYLPTGMDPRKGFAANSEQPIKLYFEFTDAKPAGFQVGVFYR